MRIGLVGAGVLATAALVGAPRESQAGVRVGIVIGSDYDGYRHGGYGHRYGYDAFRIGVSRGYEDGYRHGAKDSRHHEDYNFWHDKRYRCGDAGYKRHYGPKGEYVSGYRRGYEQGYRRAYSARHGYGRGGYGYGDGRYDDRYRDRDRYNDRDPRYDDRYDRYRDDEYDYNR